MSLHPQDFSVVPEETIRVAKAAFPKGNRYLTLRDKLGVIYQDGQFAALFTSSRGRPAESPGCLALVTALQFAENLSDRQAADAVRGRIDWKYLLGLELTDPGFDHTLLYEFRQRVLAHGAEQQLLDMLLELLKGHKLLKKRGRQRTDSTHVLAAIRALNRLELVGETMRQALNSLAAVVPDWLRTHVPGEWFERYGQPFSQWRLPKSQMKRDALTETIGQDGWLLWQLIGQSPQAMLLRAVPAVETLRQVWLQEYYLEEGQLHQRQKGNRPPAAQRIVSPYDPEARYCVRHSLRWSGYKAHVTETCDADQPRLIVNVETSASTTPDVLMTETVHQHLKERELLPGEHLLDAGYIDARVLAESQSNYQVDLVGPTRPDSSRQTKAGQGFGISCFIINWEEQTVTCPRGQTSVSWVPHRDECDKPRIAVKFARADCSSCPSGEQCFRAKSGARSLRFRPKEQHIALQKARRRQKTDEFKQTYAQRAGVEGTISQGTRVSDLRRSRYFGLAKTHLQHICIAVAINLMRLADWFQETPRAQTRCSRFAALPIAA